MHILVLDERILCGIIRVWWVSGVAVLQNSCQNWICVLHRDAHIQRWTHWEVHLAWWIRLSVVGVAEQRHGGSSFWTRTWNASSEPDKGKENFIMQWSLRHYLLLFCLFPGLCKKTALDLFSSKVWWFDSQLLQTICWKCLWRWC